MRYLVFLLFIFNISLSQDTSSILSKDAFEDLKRSNPFSHMSPEEMRAIIQEKSKDNSFGKIIEKYPKFEDFLSHWYVDEEAVPKLFSLMEDPSKVKGFFIKLIIVFVLGLMIIHYLTRSDTSFFVKFFKKLGLNFILVFCIWMIFYDSFKENLEPTVELVKTHLL